MDSHWISSDSKSPQASRTLFIILTDLNNAAVWMVSTHPVISKSSRACTNPLVTVPRVHITIGVIVSFLFQGFFSSKAQLFLVLFTFFNSDCGQPGQQNPQFCKFSFFSFFSFLLIFMSSDYLAEIKRSVCISKSQGNFCVSFSWANSWLSINYLFIWSNRSFWQNCQWILTLSFLVLYYFCANLLGFFYCVIDRFVSITT